VPFVVRILNDSQSISYVIGNHIHGFNGHISHQQIRFDVWEQADLLFEQVRAVLDAGGGNAGAGLAAFDRRGQVNAQGENILHAGLLRSGLLEGQQGGPGEERLQPAVIMVGWVLRRGLGDEQDLY